MARNRRVSNVLKWIAIVALVARCIYVALRVVGKRSDLGTAAPVNNIVDSYHGCPVFPNVYGQIVTNALPPNSAAYIASVQQVDKRTFVALTGNQQVNLATSATPLLTATPEVHYHEFPVPYPWQLGFWIKPLSDAHAIVVETSNCHLYESYRTKYFAGVLSAYSGANLKMSKFTQLPAGNPSAMASGLSLFAGMVQPEDIASGCICHALNWDAVAHSLARYALVYPASATDQLPYSGSSTYQLPYGARIRLNANVNPARCTREAQMVVTALKTFGAFAADTGGQDALYFANNTTGGDPWSGRLRCLSALTIADFVVLKLPKIGRIRALTNRLDLRPWMPVAKRDVAATSPRRPAILACKIDRAASSQCDGRKRMSRGTSKWNRHRYASIKTRRAGVTRRFGRPAQRNSLLLCGSALGYLRLPRQQNLILALERGLKTVSKSSRGGLARWTS
ncbi:MAG: hypothetical protein WBE79_13925 [Candidatus Cybelea sp.]